MSWWVLLLRRARSQPGVVAGVVAVLALTALLGTTVAVAGPAAVRAGLQDRLAAAPAAQRSVEVSAQWDRSAPRPQDDAARRLLLGALAPLPVRVEVVREGELLSLAGRTDRLVPWQGTDLREHAELTTGRWPAPGGARGPLEAALQAGAAAALGVRVGDRLPVVTSGGARPGPVVLVGLWAPRDTGDPFWRGEPLALEGLQREGVRGPLVLAEAAASRLGIDWTARWRASPALADVTPDLLQPLAASVAGLRGAVTGLPTGGGPTAGADTGFADLLTGLVAPVRSATGAARTLLVLLVAVAAALCLLVGSTLAQVRGRDDGVLRARGGGGTRRLALALREGAVWALAAAIPAAVLAPAAVALPAAGATRRAALPPGTAVAAAVAWAAAGTLLLVLVTALASRAERRGSRARAGEGLPLRPPVLLVVVVAAAAAAWQLRSADGAPGGIGPDDPVLVVAVAVLLAAASVLVVVALTAIARPGARAGGRAGPVIALAGWHAGRRGLQPVAAIAVVVLCAAGAVCLLAARQAGQDAAVTQAHRDVAPAVAVDAPVPPGTPVGAGAGQAEAAVRRLAALPGVAAVSPVLEVDGSVGSSGDVRVLAVDEDLLAPLTAGAAPAAVSPAVAALLGGTASSGSAAVPAVLSSALAGSLAVTTGQQVDVEDVDGRRLRLVVAALVDTLPADPFRPDGTPVVLVDRAGLARADAGTSGPPGAPRAARQWWLLPAPGADAGRVAEEALAVVRPLAGAGAATPSSLTRAGAERRRLADPVTGGLGRLDLVGAGALALAGAGALLLGQLASVRGRRGELAVLRAIGLSAAQARRLALTEVLLVGGTAVGAGLALGVGLAGWSTGQLSGLGAGAVAGVRPGAVAAVAAVLAVGVLVVAVVRARTAASSQVAAVVREQAL